MTFNKLTKLELLELLKDVPDSMPVYVRGCDYSPFHRTAQCPVVRTLDLVIATFDGSHLGQYDVVLDSDNPLEKYEISRGAVFQGVVLSPNPFHGIEPVIRTDAVKIR
jgi:hypothetical protein